jgi:hypothetical protein
MHRRSLGITFGILLVASTGFSRMASPQATARDQGPGLRFRRRSGRTRERRPFRQGSSLRIVRPSGQTAGGLPIYGRRGAEKALSDVHPVDRWLQRSGASSAATGEFCHYRGGRRRGTAPVGPASRLAPAAVGFECRLKLQNRLALPGCRRQPAPRRQRFCSILGRLGATLLFRVRIDERHNRGRLHAAEHTGDGGGSGTDSGRKARVKRSSGGEAVMRVPAGPGSL